MNQTQNVNNIDFEEECPYCGALMDSIEAENRICWFCKQDQIDLMDEADLEDLGMV